MITGIVNKGPLSTRLRLAVRLAILAVAVTLIGSACESGSGGPASSSSKPVLQIGLPFTPNSLDPAKANSPGFIGPLTNAPLLNMDADGTIKPGLAVSWQYVGSGNSEFQFSLRRDARFSDGAPVDASAVKTWFDYYSKEKGPLFKATKIDSVREIDQWTINIRLSGPNPMLPAQLSPAGTAGFVSSPRAVASSSSLATGTFGAGPYMLDTAQSSLGSLYTLVPNISYYDPSQIRYSKIIVRILTSPSSMLSAIQSGQVDLAYGDITTANAAKAANLNVYAANASFCGLALLDRGGKLVKALSDVRVRQALNYAVDRGAVASALFGEFATPTSEVRTQDGFDPVYQNFYRYDPSKARSLLVEAGYANGLSVDVLTQGYLGTRGTPLVQAVATYLAAVGVNLNITPAASDGEWQQKKSSFPATGSCLQSVPMAQLYGIMFQANASLNPLDWKDSQMDNLYAQGVVADPSQGAMFWKEMSRLATRQAFELPVVATDALWYASKNVVGVSVSSARPYPSFTDLAPK